MSTLDDWLSDQRAGTAAVKVLDGIAPVLAWMFAEPGGDQVGEGRSGRHLHDYFRWMPMQEVLEFASGLGGPDPEPQMDRLLRAASGG
jgi:hypothetical protein